MTACADCEGFGVVHTADGSPPDDNFWCEPDLYERCEDCCGTGEQ